MKLSRNAGIAVLVLTFADVRAGKSGIERDTNGWTVFMPSADSHLIYVSSSAGRDANNGSFPDHPVATIARGVSLLRNGYPDELLLKAGDTWANQSFGYLRVSGRSSKQPMVIGTYGTGPAPVVETPVTGDAVGIGSLGGSGRGGDFLIIQGIKFYAYQRDPNNLAYSGPHTTAFGTRFLNPITDLVIEGCTFSFYTTNIIIDASSTRASSSVTLYRDVIIDAWSADMHSQGVYIAGVNNPVVLQSVFDHNGWNASIAGAEATIFNHNLYFQWNNGPIVFSGNISANSSSDGVMARTGGTLTNNLFVNDAMGPIMGITPGSDPVSLVLTAGVVSGNVILQSTDIQSPSGVLPRSQGVVVSNAAGSGVQISNNIIANPDRAAETVNQTGISLDNLTNGITATNNIIYGFAHPISDAGTGNATSPNAINQSGYVNPNASVASYSIFLWGSAGQSAFFAEARKQSKTNWRPELTADSVNNYIRVGFDSSTRSTK